MHCKFLQKVVLPQLASMQGAVAETASFVEKGLSAGSEG